jgi:hypothetical protein
MRGSEDNHWAAGVALLLACALFSSAQTTGAIEGTVTDPSQAAVPDCTVKITSQKTGVDYSVVTNGAGYFLVEGLGAGLYDIAVNRSGFKSASVRGVTLDVASRVRQDVSLRIGQLNESVTVEANATRVETSNGTVSSVITHEQMDTAVLTAGTMPDLRCWFPAPSTTPAPMNSRVRD